MKNSKSILFQQTFTELLMKHFTQILLKIIVPIIITVWTTEESGCTFIGM